MRNQYMSLFRSFLAVIIPVVAFFMLLMHLGYAPLLTDSVSFDAKIDFERRQKIKHIDLVAVGSSMALNNLSSKVIIDSLQVSYFNFSSWGLQMADTRELVSEHLFIFNPKYIVVISSLPDFTTEGLASIKNYLNTDAFLRENFRQFFYLKNYNSFSDLKKRKDELLKLSLAADKYTSLKYDKCGGVLLNIAPENISYSRWNLKDVFPTIYSKKQYQELDSIARMSNNHHVKLIFVQSPIKKEYIYSDKVKAIVDKHFAACKNIVERNKGSYLNFHNPEVFRSDSLFVDQFHLSARGAQLFTKQLVNSLKSNLIVQ